MKINAGMPSKTHLNKVERYHRVQISNKLNWDSLHTFFAVIVAVLLGALVYVTSG